MRQALQVIQRAVRGLYRLRRRFDLQQLFWPQAHAQFRQFLTSIATEQQLALGLGVWVTQADAHEKPIQLRSEEHTSELQSRGHLVCRLLLEKKNKKNM